MTPEPVLESNVLTRAFRYIVVFWVFGTAVFFYLRFTFSFVHANREAINSFLNL